jgi:head-tail adaptor
MPLKPEGLWPSINPGDLRHKITRLNQVIGSDSSGVGIAYAPSSPPVIVPADIEILSGVDAIRDGQDVAQITAKVTIRGYGNPQYVATWQSNQRIMIPGGSTLVIKVIENVQKRNIKLVLDCVGIGPNE